MYKLEFYVPIEATKSVLQAIFKAGAGKIGHYDQCCFITTGKGQFRPLENSNPTLGSHGDVEIVEENKVELVLEDELAQKVKNALVNSHPYETPAYQFFKIDDILD